MKQSKFKLKRFNEDFDYNEDTHENVAPNEPLELAKKCLEKCEECKDICEEKGEKECALHCEKCILILELYILSIENDTENHKGIGELALDIVNKNIEVCKESEDAVCVEACEEFVTELERHLKEDY